jgi:hypothetical protein
LNSAIGYITPKDILAGQQQGSGRPGSGIGNGEGTAEESPLAGRVTVETDYSDLPTIPPKSSRSLQCVGAGYIALTDGLSAGTKSVALN